MPGPERQADLGLFQGKPAHYISGAIRDSDLVSPDDRGVVLVSGGADSVALLLGLSDVLGPASLLALHVNYGLRSAADEDEQLVRELCAELDVKLEVHRAGRPAGNLQAWARGVRLGEAERLREEEGMDWIAVGHNRSDQAETFLYRLASSPGVRSLLAMPPRSGRVIRPLLSLDSDLIRRMLKQVTPVAADATNQDPVFTRNRIRHDLLKRLEEIDPRAELNIARTRAELAEDDELLRSLATEALEQAAGPEMSLSGEALAGQHPAVRRRMLRNLAEAELGRPVAVNRRLAGEVDRLAGEPEGGSLDLGGGDRFVIESGRVRVVAGGRREGEEVPLPVEASLEDDNVTFGGWVVSTSVINSDEARSGFGNPWTAFLEEAALSELLESSPGPGTARLLLRPWQTGDRIDPLGMSGSKSLQDVFTDAGVPASRRRTWPVLEAAGTPIWVPGLVRSRHALVENADSTGTRRSPDRSGRVFRLQARPPFPI